MLSIDIIIPSYRLELKYLNTIFEINKPEGIYLNFIVICDNPDLIVSKTHQGLFQTYQVLFIKNDINLGAGLSRNVGIEHSDAEWILFLDDDVYPEKNLLFTYFDAIKKHPYENTFMGVTQFPSPINSFTKGIKASQKLFLFDYAKYFDRAICSTTSNILIKRSHIGYNRFSKDYPKNGGGEDLAFFLEIFNKTDQSIKCVKNAVVYHQWWHNGKRSYKRFLRWSLSDQILFNKMPQLTFYNLPNFATSLLLGLVIGIFMFLAGYSFGIISFIFSGIILAELFVEALMIVRHKGFNYILALHEVFIINTISNFGEIYGHLKSGQWLNLFKRLKYAATEDKLYFYGIPLLKLILSVLFSLGFNFLFRNYFN